MKYQTRSGQNMLVLRGVVALMDDYTINGQTVPGDNPVDTAMPFMLEELEGDPLEIVVAPFTVGETFEPSGVLICFDGDEASLQRASQAISAAGGIADEEVMRTVQSEEAPDRNWALRMNLADCDASCRTVEALVSRLAEVL